MLNSTQITLQTIASWLSMVLLFTLLLIPSTDAHGESVFEAPQRLVPGVALIRMNDASVTQIQLQSNKSRFAARTLDEIASRSNIRLTLEKVAPLNFGLYRLERLGSSEHRQHPTEEETEQMIEELSRDPAIDRIAPNKWYRRLIVPNDAYVSDMWHLESIHAAAGWNYTTGDAAQRVGVIDTGLVRQHEDLQEKDQGGYDFISEPDVAQDGSGRDADYTDEGDGGYCQGFGYLPDSWHGTHVAGTILATTNNNLGIAGMNWEAKLMTVRALGRCGGDSYDIMSGALWLTGYPIDDVPTLPEEDRVSVMNLSLGAAGYCSAFEQEIIDTINSRNAVFVAASGNDGGAVGSPANCTGVISVAASGPSGNLASYSSFGPEVEVVAPGGDGPYTDQGVASASGPGVSDYAYQQGTSMAAPHVAGAISLAQALDGSLTAYQSIKGLLNQGVSCGNCQNVPALRLDLILQDVVPDGTPADPALEPEDDSFEENDSFETAALIHCGDELNLYAGALDYDFFSFTSEENTPVNVSISSSSGADIDLYLVKGMNFPSDVILASESPTGDESLQFTSTGQPMVLLINPWYNSQTSNFNNDEYQLNIDCEPQGAPVDLEEEQEELDEADIDAVDDDPYEINNSPEDATGMGCNEQRELILKDEDWFVVRMDDNSALSIETIATDAPATLSLYSGDNLESPLVEASSMDLRHRIEVNGLNLGNYFIHVNFEDRSTFYTLDVQCTTMPTVDATGCRHVEIGSKEKPGLLFGFSGAILLSLFFRRRRR